MAPKRGENQARREREFIETFEPEQQRNLSFLRQEMRRREIAEQRAEEAKEQIPEAIARATAEKQEALEDFWHRTVEIANSAHELVEEMRDLVFPE